MDSLIDLHHSAPINPLDRIEQFVADNHWNWSREGEDELTVGVGGDWCDYNMWFSWREEVSALIFCCAFEVRVPAAIQPALHKLLVLLNERLMLGHFDLWGKEGMLLFRQALLLRGSDGATAEQVEDMIEIALSESERYFPAIQFVLWGGKSPEEAIAAALLDTVGEA